MLIVMLLVLAGIFGFLARACWDYAHEPPKTHCACGAEYRLEWDGGGNPHNNDGWALVCPTCSAVNP